MFENLPYLVSYQHPSPLHTLLVQTLWEVSAWPHSPHGFSCFASGQFSSLLQCSNTWVVCLLTPQYLSSLHIQHILHPCAFGSSRFKPQYCVEDWFYRISAPCLSFSPACWSLSCQIVVRGTPEATASLVQFARKTLGINESKVASPGIGECVDATTESQIYQVCCLIIFGHSEILARQTSSCTVCVLSVCSCYVSQLLMW